MSAFKLHNKMKTFSSYKTYNHTQVWIHVRYRSTYGPKPACVKRNSATFNVLMSEKPQF